MRNDQPAPLKAKVCYGHLGGTLGNRLFERLLELGWLCRSQDAVTACELTDVGQREFARLGIDIYTHATNGAIERRK